MSMLDKINSGYYDNVIFKEGDLLRLYKWIRFYEDLRENLSLTDEELKACGFTESEEKGYYNLPIN